MTAQDGTAPVRGAAIPAPIHPPWLGGGAVRAGGGMGPAGLTIRIKKELGLARYCVVCGAVWPGQVTYYLFSHR